MMNTVEQAKIYKRNYILAEQKAWARQGISSAVVDGFVVTVGDKDCDYISFKEFLVSRMAYIGMRRFANLTNLKLDELIKLITNEDPSESVWFKTAEKYFDAMEGDY